MTAFIGIGPKRSSGIHIEERSSMWPLSVTLAAAMLIFEICATGSDYIVWGPNMTSRQRDTSVREVYWVWMPIV